MNIKKLGLFLTVCTLVLCLFATTTYAQQQVNVQIDGRIVVFQGQRPVIESGTTLIPMRGVFEALGFDVYWSNASKGVILLKDKDVFELHVGSAYYKHNFEVRTLNLAVKTINGSTMIPLRGVLEEAGYEIVWDNSTKLITIYPKGQAPTIATTQATTEASTEVTTATVTTAKATTVATTVATTKATTEATTVATTVATTKATTKATTEATTVATTVAKTKATTEATTETTTEDPQMAVNRKFLNDYKKQMDAYNYAIKTYNSYIGSLAASGLKTEDDYEYLKKRATDTINAIDEVKAAIQKLQRPEKYTQLYNLTLDYLDASRASVNLYVAYAEKKTETFTSQYDKVYDDLAKANAAFKEVYNPIFVN